MVASCRWSPARRYTYKGKQCATIRTWEQTLHAQPSRSVQASVCESARCPGGSGAAARGAGSSSSSSTPAAAALRQQLRPVPVLGGTSSSRCSMDEVDIVPAKRHYDETTNLQVVLLHGSTVLPSAHRPPEPAWRRFSTAFHWSCFFCSARS